MKELLWFFNAMMGLVLCVAFLLVALHILPQTARDGFWWFAAVWTFGMAYWSLLKSGDMMQEKGRMERALHRLLREVGGR